VKVASDSAVTLFEVLKDKVVVNEQRSQVKNPVLSSRESHI